MQMEIQEKEIGAGTLIEKYTIDPLSVISNLFWDLTDNHYLKACLPILLVLPWYAF